MQAEGKIILYQDDLISISYGFPTQAYQPQGDRKIEVPACSSQADQLDGGSRREHFVSKHRGATHTLGQTQPPPTPQYWAPASWAPGNTLGRSRSQTLFSSPSLPHSPAMGLQIAHGDMPNIHLEAKSNKGGIKRTCTIQEASTAAQREQYINRDCSSEDLEIKKTKVLIELSHSALTLCFCIVCG